MVLVVEDDPIVRIALLQMLEILGYATVEFEDAESAANFLNSGGIDEISMIASDFMLPGKTGLELINHARTLRPNIPAMIISGYTAQLIPFDIYFLQKPYRLTELKKMVEACYHNQTVADSV